MNFCWIKADQRVATLDASAPAPPPNVIITPASVEEPQGSLSQALKDEENITKPGEDTIIPSTDPVEPTVSEQAIPEATTGKTTAEPVASTGEGAESVAASGAPQMSATSGPLEDQPSLH